MSRISIKYDEIVDQRKNIINKKWDNLIILDACRYDFFENVHEEYLRGHLRKCISVGSTTIPWLIKTFTKKFKDVIYISANPFIRSKSFSPETQSSFGYGKFTAKEYFYHVVDVWNWGWDNKNETIHPKYINYAVRKYKKQFPKKKFIIHYIQPHVPYLCLSRFSIYNIVSVIYWNLQKYLGTEVTKKILIKLRLNINNPAMQLQNYGKVNLKKAYELNLRIVLKYVKELSKDLSGKTIVTSDHGEMLGENNVYGHFWKSKNTHLRSVPWFEINAHESNT